MSTNAPQVQRPQDDPFWIPRRVHGGLRHLRRVGRGKNRQYRFQGQMEGEVVKLVIRRHKFFLITPALPLIASILAFIGVIVLGSLYPAAGAFWTFLELVAGAAILATAIYFIYKDLILWWLETYIITNKRILEWKGLVTPSRQEVPLENVQQVAIDQPSLLSTILSYGDVHLYLAGGKGLTMNHIPSPKKVRDSLQQITVQARESKPSAKPQIPPDLDWRGVLAILAKGDAVPALPNPDQKYAHRQRPGDVRRPLRTFGGPLRIPCDVRYTSGEETVMYVQRSKYILALRLILPILVLLATIVLSLYFPHLLLYTALAILAILLWIGLTIINYVDDVFIFTNRRIIDIERKFIFLYEEHDATEYSKIKDILVNVGNPLFLSLDVGTVKVETPGTSPDIILSFVDHPFSLQDMIYAIKGFKEKVDKIEGTNKRKEELNTWFGTVLNTMEKTVLGRGVPNLQKLDLFAAAARAREFGMKVVPVGEDASYPNIESGLIVAQNPLPGTLMHVDSNNPEERPLIQVILSKRP
jgi:membrane protein YdbS with pleckstrin-like domain